MPDSNQTRELSLSGSVGTAVGWIVVIALIPVVIGIAAAFGVLATAPAATTQRPVPLLAFLPPVVILLSFAWLVLRLRRAGVRVGQGTLIVNTGLGSKRVALANLRARSVRVIDLDEHRELQPSWRSWGTGLPGFRAGWYRLRNGERAVCLLLDRHRVSYLRSEADNLSLLLSLAEPETLRTLIGSLPQGN